MTWNLSKLIIKTQELTKELFLSANINSDLLLLINTLNKIVIAHKINLPEPNIEKNPEATIDFIWFDRKNQSALGFTICAREHDECNDVWLHSLCKNKAQDIYNPSEQQIANALYNFYVNGILPNVSKQIRISMIMERGEDGKLKFIPESNNIVEKHPNILTDSAKLEKISDIVWDLGFLDEGEVEHQITCHRDTLEENYRAAMKALDKIKNFCCMSSEEMDDMEIGVSI